MDLLFLSCFLRWSVLIVTLPESGIPWEMGLGACHLDWVEAKRLSHSGQHHPLSGTLDCIHGWGSLSLSMHPSLLPNVDIMWPAELCHAFISASWMWMSCGQLLLAPATLTCRMMVCTLELWAKVNFSLLSCFCQSILPQTETAAFPVHSLCYFFWLSRLHLFCFCQNVVCFPHTNRCHVSSGTAFFKAYWQKSPVKEESVVSGVSDIQGCVCGLLLGGVDAARFCAEEAVWRPGAGELQEPGLPGWEHPPTPLQLDLSPLAIRHMEFMGLTWNPSSRGALFRIVP